MSGYPGYRKQDNIRRKINNTGEALDQTVNPNVKEYSRNGQGSYREQSQRLANEAKKKSQRMPCKLFNKETSIL